MKIEKKRLLTDVFDAYFYVEDKLVFSSENLTSTDIKGSADEKEVRNGRGNGLFAKLYSNKKVDITIKTNAFDFSTIAMLAGTTVGTGSGTCYTPSLVQQVKSGKIVLPYTPKDTTKVEVIQNDEVLDNSKLTFAKNEVTITGATEGVELKINPYEFEMTSSQNDEYKEIIISANKFPKSGKLVLKGVEKTQGGEDYKDLTIIIEKAVPSADFSLSTSSEVEAAETEIKLSALVENGRLMKIIEGNTIDKNGTFKTITP